MEIKKPFKPKKKSKKIQTNSPKHINNKSYTKTKPTASRRSKRHIKKPNISNDFISNLDDIIHSDDEREYIIPSQSKNDITFKGNLLYRFSLDQIEFKGEWASLSPKDKYKSTPYSKSKQLFAYLLMKKERIIFTLQKHQIDFTNNTQSNEHKYFKGDTYSLSISSGNLLELLLIKSPALLNHILLYLSGNYNGYFIYEGKTIEDDFFITFLYENDTVRIVGNGQNHYGKFQLSGGIDFITSKEDVIARNEGRKEEDEVSLGEITIIKTYIS